MNTQFKKGVLELIVLICLCKKDMYGYELVTEISKIIDVNEGTIYPLLKRLTNDNHCETYLKESTEGPPRKYYHISVKGINYKNEGIKEWNKFSKEVNKFIKENDND